MRTPILLMMILALGACTPRGGGRGGSGGSSRGNNAEGAAKSLTNALTFSNAGATRVDGALPDPDNDAPELVDEDDMGGEITPGSNGTIGIRVSNENPDDPIVATLVWFQGANSFFSLPTGGATRTDGTIQNDFQVSQDLCDDLCNIVHQVKCYEAAQTSSGLVTKANLSTILVECTGSGDPAKCANTTPPTSTSDAGSTDTGGGGNTNTGTACQKWCSWLTACAPPDAMEGDCVSDCTTGSANAPAGCIQALEATLNCLNDNWDGTANGCAQSAQSCASQAQSMSSACDDGS